MSISKIVISGQVVKTPEKRFTPNTNVAVTEFFIAVTPTPRQGQPTESALIKVITWRDLAERCASELQKGDTVAVDGRLQINNFTTAEGQKRKDMEIDAVSVENLGTGHIFGSGGGGQQAASSSNANQNQKVEALSRTGGGAKKSGSGQDDLDAIFAEDEIPF